MYAIVKIGGKQYRLSEGTIFNIEKIKIDNDEKIDFNEVLVVVNGDTMQIGRPFVTGASVTAKIVEHGKSKKILVFKYKAKSNYRRRQGHRQPFTKVIIEKINVKYDQN